MPDNNALHDAAIDGDIVQVKSHVGNFDINSKGKDNKTALIIAAEKGHADIVKLFLTLNADVNIPDVSTSKMESVHLSIFLIHVPPPPPPTPSPSPFLLNTSTSVCTCNPLPFILSPLPSSPLFFPYLIPPMSVYVCNPLPFILSPPPPPLTLQGKGKTALTLASEKGHTQAIKALLTVPGIDVNHADVSLYPPTHPI